MAVGAQDVGEHEGVAGIALAAGGAVTRPAGLDHVWVNGHHRMACLHQRIDDQARRALDGDGNVAGRCQTIELLAQFRQAGGIVRDFEVEQHGPGFVDHADGVADAPPIRPAKIWHGQFPLGCSTLPSVGRSCGTLIDRRSGPLSLALHPVARRVLPAPAMRRVSSWPFSGKRTWPSWRVLGSRRPSHPACAVRRSTNANVQQ